MSAPPKQTHPARKSKSTNKFASPQQSTSNKKTDLQNEDELDVSDSSNVESFSTKVRTPKLQPGVGPFDVLVGRGKGIAQNPGNVHFRCVIWDKKAAYLSTGDHRVKTTLAWQVLKQVWRRGGRFVEPVDGGQGLQEIDKARALEKACQALRELKTTQPPKGYAHYLQERRKLETLQKTSQAEEESHVVSKGVAEVATVPTLTAKATQPRKDFKNDVAKVVTRIRTINERRKSAVVRYSSTLEDFGNHKTTSYYSMNSNNDISETLPEAAAHSPSATVDTAGPFLDGDRVDMEEDNNEADLPVAADTRAQTPSTLLPQVPMVPVVPLATPSLDIPEKIKRGDKIVVNHEESPAFLTLEAASKHPKAQFSAVEKGPVVLPSSQDADAAEARKVQDSDNHEEDDDEDDDDPTWLRQHFFSKSGQEQKTWVF